MIASIIQKATKSIDLVDGYVDVVTLNLLAKKKKDAGKECFGITLIQDDTMANDLISRLKKILSDDIENKHRKEYNRDSSQNKNTESLSGLCGG